MGNLKDYMKRILSESMKEKDRRRKLLIMKIAYQQKHDGKMPSCLCGPINGENATDTSDRIPDSTIDSWIHYWQIAVGNNDNKLKCSLCGKPIFVDTETSMCKITASELGKDVKPEDIKAIGGHIRLKGYKDFYITPLCPKCNSQDKLKIQFLPCHKLAKEENAQIIKKD